MICTRPTYLMMTIKMNRLHACTFSPLHIIDIIIVRNVVAQGKSDKLTEIDRQKSLRNKNELLELKSRNQGRITLATQKQH